MDDLIQRQSRRKRRITDERRAQGRAAQSRYRLKQKQKRATDNRSTVDARQSAENEACPITPESLSNELIQEQAQAVGNGSRSHLRGLNGTIITHQTIPEALGLEGVGVADSSSSVYQQRDINDSLWSNASSMYALSNDLIDTTSTGPSIPLDSFILMPRVSFRSACIENAVLLGIPRTSVYDHSCGDCALVTPWFIARPQPVNPLHNQQTLEQSLRQKAPELLPTLNQTLHDHSLLLDVLPFTNFRERLLAIRAAGSGVFDENEFTNDVDFGDAFRCWGPTPWESKSWEIADWFINKWWLATGGRDGEMAKTSRWWKMLRRETL